MIKGWKATTIRDAAQFTSKPRYIDLKIAEKVPFVPMDLVPQDRSFIQDCVWKPGRDIRSGTYFEKGDCLLAKITPCFENGKQGIAKDLPASFGYASTELIPFRGRAGLSNKYFLFFFFLDTTTRRLIAQKMEGATGRQRIPISVLKDWPISLPPLPEQKKIAAVLLKLQQAIETQEKIIQSLRDLKASTMQHLFTHGLHGEKTKQTEIGPIPESWEVSTLGDLCGTNGSCIQTGPFGSQLHAADYQDTGVPVVNPTHMLDNAIIHEGIPCISQANADRLGRHRLKQGDILFARRGEIGRHALVTESEIGWLCGTGCFLVRVRNNLILDSFLSWFLYSQQSQNWLAAHAAGAIMPNLNNTILKACPIAFPSTKAEQKHIVETLSGIDTKAFHHQSKKSALQDLFKTTLNKLMTGDIRVTDLDIDTKEVEE